MALRNFREGSASFQQVLDWSFPWRRIMRSSSRISLAMSHITPTWTCSRGKRCRQNVQRWTVHLVGAEEFRRGAAYLGILPLVLALFGILTAKAQRSPRDSKIPWRPSFLCGSYSIGCGTRTCRSLRCWHCFHLRWSSRPACISHLLPARPRSTAHPVPLGISLYALDGGARRIRRRFSHENRQDVGGQDGVQSVPSERHIKMWRGHYSGREPPSSRRSAFRGLRSPR